MNIIPKHDGQATVARRAPQWSHREASLEAGAPHIGHFSVSTGVAIRVGFLKLSPFSIPNSLLCRLHFSLEFVLSSVASHGDDDANTERHPMSLIDYLKTQFLEIIQWQDDSRDTISFRYPDMQKEIKRGAQLIVRESQVAQFVYQGQFGDTFGPGTHTLVTDNIPILSTLKGWKYGLESPFKADVYFVNTRLFTGNKWGTANPIMMRDPDFGMVRVRAYGTYDFHVVDVKLFLNEVAGTNDHFRLEEFGDTMRSRIVSVFTEAVAQAKLPVLDVASRYQELGEALLPVINPAVTSKYGLQIPSFIVENISLPPEVEQAIDKRSSMAAVGNLNDYIKYQMAEGMTKAEGGGGMAGTAAQLGAGLAMGQQIAQAMSAVGQTTPSAVPPVIASAGAAASSAPELLTPASAALVLNVSEADVLSALADGSLKGKKIGASWRITRSALDEFLKS
jgi:excisionase family DNA binding protein